MAPLEFVCNVDGERALAITLGGGRAARDGELPRLTAAERNALATLLLREVPKAGSRAGGSANTPRGGWPSRREAGLGGRKPRKGRQPGRGRPRRKGAACKRRRDLRRSARAIALASALRRVFVRRVAASRIAGALSKAWAWRKARRASQARLGTVRAVVATATSGKRRRVGRGDGTVVIDGITLPRPRTDQERQRYEDWRRHADRRKAAESAAAARATGQVAAR